MPIKFTNTAKALKIEWTTEDGSETASFSVPKQVPETDQVKALLKAVGFLGARTGVVPTLVSGAPPAQRATPESAMSTMSTAPTPDPGPPTGARVQMMPPASLSDRPAGGTPPSNVQFWESMPTIQVPGELAGGPMGWEMMPEGDD